MVEFGLLAAPFLFLMVCILEVAQTFWTNQVLETAVQNASRQIYTGQFQTDPTNASQPASVLAARFKTVVCSNVTALFNCPAALAVDVRNITSYATGAPPSMITSGSYDTSGFSYQSLAPGQTALVTASINVRPLTRVLAGTPGLSDGSRIIMATAVFQVEPYQQ